MSGIPALPGVLAEVEQAAGRETAIRIALEWGGSEIYFPSARHLAAHPDHPLAGILADEGTALAVAARIGGSTVYIPRARRACAAHLAAAGLAADTIARRLGISLNAARRYVRA